MAAGGGIISDAYSKTSLRNARLHDPAPAHDAMFEEKETFMITVHDMPDESRESVDLRVELKNPYNVI